MTKHITSDKIQISEKTVEDIYKKKSHHQHILDESDLYIGSKDTFLEDIYIYDEELQYIVKKQINYTPGLYKIIDEILVNSRDHYIRDKTCDTIMINITNNSISVYNNGNGIPIELHKEHNIYVPELIFGHLLTSSNYNQKNKIVGGKNGMGSKCVHTAQLIILYDGTIKRAGDITLTDKLIGDDGTVRNIKNIIRGTGQMYKIAQIYGEPYIVNDQHILTVKNEDKIIDISIDEYIKFIVKEHINITGIRGKCVKWDKQEVIIEPYTLGLWLGNNVINIDEQLLKKYNLIRNKHIPIEYKVNDKYTRQQLLKGIHNACKYYFDITQQQLVNDVVFVSRSLGYYTKVTIVKNTDTLIPDYYYISINQNKQSTGHLIIMDAGIDDYVGFEIDGNQRFVLNDFTVTHNCTNIFSKRFEVETIDKNKKYVQVFENNMYTIHPPTITTVKREKPYTKISIIPDFERFGLTEFSSDMISLIKKRAYDIAACTNVKVYFNDTLIILKTFEDYIRLFYKTLPSELIYEEFNDRWRVGVLYDTFAGHQHVSYVNGICTLHGGTHVKYVTDQIVNNLIQHIKKKNKDLNIKPQYIKENLTIFVDCIIEDPTYESQTKDLLKKKVSEFGSKCEISDKFIQKLIKTGICTEVMRITENKENIALNKVGGTKTERMKDIPKLEDAEEAGKRQAKLCKLILTEGDSAKKFAVDGISFIGNKYLGVYPLRGKLLNVRDMKPKDLQKNEEIDNVMKILGLKIKTDKEGNILKEDIDINKLRYGGIIILTDQDYDGSHIKGLIINFIHYFWPKLLENDYNFIQSIITPIVKVFKGKKNDCLSFNTINSFNDWKDNNNIKGWTVKYYKGLGTSDKTDAIEIFNELNKRQITYKWDNSDSLDMAFNKKRADDRKLWLQKYNKTNVIDYDKTTEITYNEFIDQDLIHFSNYDVERSVAAIDGFKPSQRKVLYGCLTNKKLKSTEIKVSQLAGYIAEHTEYHHGEANLFGTIIKMAQNFKGANNINLLLPNGNFGSYRDKGHDAAAPRYIFTEINPLTYKLFRKEDEKIYTYQFEDNIKVEPVLYAPIIPVLLINGKVGIGTGFSTNIPMYNPKDICNNIIKLLNNQEQIKMIPWYRGFKGKIIQITSSKYKSQGIYTNDNKSVHITELPIGTSIEEYKEFLEKYIIDIKNPSKTQFIESYKSIPDNNNVNITITFNGTILQELIKNDILTEKLKLETTINTTNMWLYDADGHLRKYTHPEDIIADYYAYRYKMYELRKKYYIKILENKFALLNYKKLFIEFYLAGKIIINKSTTDEDVINQLIKYEFPKLKVSVDDDEDDDDTNTKPKTYDYITCMRLFSLTKNKIEELEKELTKINKELEDYKILTVKQLWQREINEFLEAYEKYLLDMDKLDQLTIPVKKQRKTTQKNT